MSSQSRLSSLSSIVPVEEGGTERAELGHGILIGNGTLPVISLEATSDDVFPIFRGGVWALIQFNGGTISGAFIPLDQKGIPQGVATLDESGKILASQMNSIDGGEY